MKKLLLGILVLACCGPAAEAGSRRCKATQMDGDWVGFQNAVVVNPHTGACDFTVSQGAVTGNCDFSAPFNSSFSFVGTVAVSEDCSVEMVMDFAPAPFVSTFHLQLSRDRQSFVGRWENTFGVLGTTSGVKR